MTRQSTKFLAVIVSCIYLCGVGCAAQANDSVPEADAAQGVTELAAQPQVREAFAFFRAEDERNVNEVIELTEIPAPPFEESVRAAAIAEKMRQAGLDDVQIDEVGNVVGRRMGSNPNRTVAFVAHIDTVFPAETDVTVRRQGDIFYAPGIGDNTRGVVLLLSVLRAFEKFDIATEANILFIGSVGEEGLGDLRGVRHLFRDGADMIDSFIAVDGGKNGRVVHRAVGSHRYRVTVSGAGGHSWGAFGAANPHHAMARGVADFVDAARVITAEGEKTSYNIGRVGGGTSINSIPAEVWLEVDMRSGVQDNLDQIDKVFQRTITDAVKLENQLRARGEPLTVDIASVGKRPAGGTPASSPLVNRAVAALRIVGVEARLAQSSTDANIPMAKGIPAITISRGGVSKNAHAPNESWQNKDSHLMLQSGFLVLLAEAGLSQ